MFLFVQHPPRHMHVPTCQKTHLDNPLPTDRPVCLLTVTPPPRQPAQVVNVARLLGVDETSLGEALTVKALRVRNEVQEVHLNTEQASANRDAMARMVYSKLFEWIFEQVRARAQWLALLHSRVEYRQVTALLF